MGADSSLLKLTADIVSAHAAHNQVSPGELADLIRSVYAALGGSTAPPQAPQEPAVPPKQSVFPDYIVCLEDGKRLKMLKRHLSHVYGMTVDEYRSKWGLPKTYPMVAPNYAKHRSSLAKKIGLGRNREAPPSEAAVQHHPEGRTGRRRRRNGSSPGPA